MRPGGAYTANTKSTAILYACIGDLVGIHWIVNIASLLLSENFDFFILVNRNNIPADLE